jgi:uncharacterized membrane protein YjdF
MNPILSRGAVLLFTLSYIGISAAYLLSTRNAEFTRYLIVLIIAVAFFVVCRDRLPFPTWLLWLISLVGLGHLLGGIVRVGNDVLYAYVPVVIPNAFELTILKYDQILHAGASAVGALVVYAFLRKAGDLNVFAIAVITFLASLGIGAVNEIVEFWVSLTVPGNGVGGYYNNSLDLVFNAIGATVATALALRWWKPGEKIVKR